MNRRYFLRAAAMPMAVTGLSGCSEGLQGFWSKDTRARTDVTKAIVEKVKTAMLCMQRYSWEHGTAMQGMLEIGDTTNLIIMARESVQRKNPDGRLSMVGSDMNIADTGVNGAGVLAAYKIPADKMRRAVYANVDEFGLLQNASATPLFNAPGTSTEGQAFFLMMEGAFGKLNNYL